MNLGAKKFKLVVRKWLHAHGFRFRLHRKDLPGKPDIVLPKYRTAVFVHGCFWHRHEGCPRATMPKTNTEFWEEKLRKNAERDARVAKELESLGWRVVTIWECEAKSIDSLDGRLESIGDDSRCHSPERSWSAGNERELLADTREIR